MATSAPLAPFGSFEDACEAVLRCLEDTVGLTSWMVTRTTGNDWIVLAARDRQYGIRAGQVFRWDDSMCYHMVRGAPRIAADANEVPQYASAPIGRLLPIRAYIGVPLVRSDGSMFGTLCAIDPSPRDETVVRQLPLVETMARVIATMLDWDLNLQQRQRELETTRLAAATDELTGALNRAGWNAVIRAEEERARRYGHAVSIAVFDLDGLKQLNDSEGHEAGDDLLRRASGTLRHALRAIDVVARTGGDEFAVLLPETAAAEATPLLGRVTAAFTAAGIRISAGLATWDRQSSLPATMKSADQAMYRAKSART
jgi:diguanylate cyclase